MAWKYYKNGELKAECDDIPETMEDAVRELREQGHDVSDCVLEPSDKDGYADSIELDSETHQANLNRKHGIAFCDDNWSPDYPPEEDEYDEYSLTHTVDRDDNHEHPSSHTINVDKLIFAPVTDEEVKRFEEEYKILEESGKALKVSKDFTDKLYGRIKEETGANMKPTRLERLADWWSKWTVYEKAYLSFWLIFFYLGIGLIQQDVRIVQIVCEIILWPFLM